MSDNQTAPGSICLPDRFVFGGGGEFMGYKNAMDNDCESIYHSTTSFHRGQNGYTNIPPPTQNGSGFVFSFLETQKEHSVSLYSASALAMIRETGADGIAIGRGAVGNPFIFAEITAALEGREFVEPTTEERVETALLQLRTAIEEKGERMAIPEARKQIALYLRSFRGAARIRAEINRALTYDEVANALRLALKDE